MTITDRRRNKPQILYKANILALTECCKTEQKGSLSSLYYYLICNKWVGPLYNYVEFPPDSFKSVLQHACPFSIQISTLLAPTPPKKPCLLFALKNLLA